MASSCMPLINPHGNIKDYFHVLDYYINFFLVLQTSKHYFSKLESFSRKGIPKLKKKESNLSNPSKT